MSTVRMLHSVGEHAAGSEVELPDRLADQYVIKGYAEGELSQEYSDTERNELLSTVQEVSV